MKRLLLVCGLLMACDRGATVEAANRATRGIVVRDSAGITVVQHSVEAMSALPIWRLDTLPLETITGAADSGFTEVRGIIRLTDGSYVISDVRRRDIRRYEATGALRAVVARAGNGPGEIGYVTGLQQMAGDSIGMVDANARRFSMLSAEGRFLGQLPYPRFTAGDRLTVVGRLDDGRLLGKLTAPFDPAHTPKDSVFTERFAVVAVTITDSMPAATGAAARVDTIAVVSGGRSYFATTTENGETRPDVYPLRFSASTAFATDGRRVVMADADIHQLRLYERGRLVRISNAPDESRPVTDADRSRLLSDVDSAMRAARMPANLLAEWLANAKRWRFAARFGHYQRLLMTDNGGVWGEVPWVSEEDARRYVVFDSTGRAVARVQLPPHVVPFVVSDSMVIGRTRDADDVPVVARWRVLRR